MNKQVVIAGVLGAASAQGCEDAFTKAGKELETEIADEKAAFVAKTDALALAVTTANDAQVAAQEAYDTKNSVWTPLNLALTTATANLKVQSDALAAATSAVTALTVPADTSAVPAAATALTDAQGLVTTQQGKINTQADIVAKLDKAVTDHVTEKGILTTALQTATTAEATAIQAATDAATAKTNKELENTTSTTGNDAVLAAATATKVTPLSDYNTAVSAETTDYTTNYKTPKNTADKAAKLAAIIALGCASSATCVGVTNDTIDAMKTAADSASSTATNALTTPTALKTNWDTKATDVATKKDLLQVIIETIAMRQANVTTVTNAVSTLTNDATTADAAKNTATSAKSDAQTAFNTVGTQITQAETDQTRGNTVLTALKTALVPLSDDVIVKTYLKKIQDDKLTVQEEAKAAANLLIADLTGLKTMATENLVRAAATRTFYQGLLDAATNSKTVADGLVTANDTAITNLTTSATATTLKLAMYVADCKENGYEEAQKAAGKKQSEDEANVELAKTVLADYTAKAAFASSGEKDTLCAYPAKAADAAQLPRPECKEGFCCGAAQKFLKDGTKLAIETCQALGEHTYQYYPPLPAAAVKEPTPETWRFQCISGAQKLAAAATAALAASYMMA